MATNNKPFAWDKYDVVAEIERMDKDDVIRVASAELKGKNYVDVRNFWLNKNTDELAPGKGIAIPTAEAMPVQVATAILCSYGADAEAMLAIVSAEVLSFVAKSKKAAKKPATKKPKAEPKEEKAVKKVTKKKAGA